MKDRYYAGFMQEMPVWMKNVRHLRRPVLAYLIDVVILLYAWTILSFIYNTYAYGVPSYTTLPWWWMLLVVLETAALWQNFGVSLGLKLLGIRVTTPEGESPGFGRRVIRYLVWHVSGLPVIGYIDSKEASAWHDLASGLRRCTAEPSHRDFV